MTNAYDSVDHLVALQSARKRLLAVIEELDEAGAEQVVHGEWRVRDLLTHLAAWDNLTIDFLRDVTAGSRTFEATASPDADWSAWNAAQIEAGRAAGAASSVEERRRHLDATRDALLDVVYALEPSVLELSLLAPWGFEDTVLGHLLAQAVHDAVHTDQIMAALEQR
ncbi:MAG: ClbS/DfsB family four-helix bundle protein [Dehalococcoidia bacterium]|nr:ClbS/DfsB family four-helix bundle protein [Dehalococcoidia bacterium]